MFASPERTSVKVGGSTVDSEPTMGITTSSVAVVVFPVPSSKETS